MASDISQSTLNLTSEEKRLYGQLFQQADTERLGIVTGDVAVKFFERTKLNPTVLAEIWQLADLENRGLLTPAGFSVALRLIGHSQAGRDPSAELAKQPGPLPRFDVPGASSQPPPPPDSPQPVVPQTSGPIRVPPLTADKVNEYAGLFDKAGARNGFLGGEAAKQMFERAGLSNESLGRIWNLSDTEQRGALNMTEFIIAMHFIASMKSGSLRSLPQSLPAGLYEAASRRGPTAPTPTSQTASPSVSRQLTGQMPQRTQSPLSRGSLGPQSLSPQTTGDAWLITPQDKAKFDQIFASVDKSRSGYINGEQAVQFFSTSGLSEDTLASIWDLADIRSEGQLNRDEFAVAMYLIRQQRGKRDDRGNLPTTLPSALIPPSMRQRTMPPSQPTAPAFDNAAFAPQQPKSAADDLFGLDAMSASDQTSRQVPSTPTSPQRPQPFQTPPPPQAGPSTSFRPFVPTSSFGQGLATQSTGGSAQGAAQPQTSRGLSEAFSSGGDDLLGDNDPDVSNKLNDESAELGNMSNQIGQLRTRMQEAQTKKTATEGDITATSNQKRELETRLAEFRAQYEQQVRDVKALEERLTSSRAETRKLQQEMAMLEGAHQDLQTQHQQVGAALEADQQENASLKERIQQMNTQVSQLRPQLDKMRSDARQQKGMVAINKKQLATSEGERDKIQSEMGDLEKESAERSALAQAAPQEPSAAPVASPALSTTSQNTNPFFRRAPESTTERSMSPSVFTPSSGAAGGQSAFDSFFGPSEASSQPIPPPPTTSFRSATPQAVPATPPVATPPVASPAVSNADSLQASVPPAPPESRQITSSALPLRGSTLLRSDSFSSSVKANAPASRAGESASATPTRFAGTPADSLDGDEGSDDEAARTPEAADRSLSFESPVAATQDATQRTESGAETIRPTVPMSTIPGAFPAESPAAVTPPVESDETQSRSVETSNPSVLLFGAAQPATSSSSASSTPAAAPLPTTGASEFPPIQDIQDDDDSSSASEAGFADDFASSAPAPAAVAPVAVAPVAASATAATSNGAFAPTPAEIATTSAPVSEPTATAVSDSRDIVPPTDSLPAAQATAEEVGSNINEPPTSTEHASPPPYEQPMTSGRDERESNQFPPEFGGLLPSREITHSPPVEVPQSPPAGLTASVGDASVVNGTTREPTAVAPSAEPEPEDEFDSAFEDLSEAKEADDGAGDDSFANSQNDHEYNPVFESPAPALQATPTPSFADRLRTPTSPSATSARATDSFSNFQPSQSAAVPSLSSPSQPPQVADADSSSHDWDAIFAGLDTSSTATAPGSDPFALQGGSFTSPTSAAAAAPSALAPPPAAKPTLARTMSTGTEHDDPILKTLTSMGYPREDALKALEKYDYNLDMAADYLTSRH